MKQVCFIVGAGSPCDSALNPLFGDYVIAADAGYNTLERLGITADLLVGDFDSLGFRPEHPNIVEHPPEKDDTDMMLAVKEGLRRGKRTFVILGGLGGRLDHTLANIQTLAYLAEHDARGFLFSEETAVTVIKNDTLTFSDKNRGVISVFSEGSTARGVYLKGLKYELTDAVLTSSMPLGVSNEFLSGESAVTVQDGLLTVLWQAQPEIVVDNIRNSGDIL